MAWSIKKKKKKLNFQKNGTRTRLSNRIDRVSCSGQPRNESGSTVKGNCRGGGDEKEAGSESGRRERRFPLTVEPVLSALLLRYTESVPLITMFPCLYLLSSPLLSSLLSRFSVIPIPLQDIPLRNRQHASVLPDSSMEWLMCTSWEGKEEKKRRRRRKKRKDRNDSSLSCFSLRDNKGSVSKTWRRALCRNF